MVGVTFTIKRRIGKIGEKVGYGFTKELNIVEWNEAKPKYDIREWDENHERMTRGITLTKDEAQALYHLLRGEFEDVEV